MNNNNLTKRDRVEMIISDIARDLTRDPEWSEKLGGYVVPNKSERSIVCTLENALEIRGMTLTNNQFWNTVSKIQKLIK